VIKIDKKIKEYIAENKLSDEDIYAKLTAEIPAELPAADQEEQEENDTSANEADPDPAPSVEENQTGKSDAEIEAMVNAKVKEYINKQPKDEPAVIPSFDNPRTNKPMFRKLKMNRS